MRMSKCGLVTLYGGVVILCGLALFGAPLYKWVFDTRGRRAGGPLLERGDVLDDKYTRVAARRVLGTKRHKYGSGRTVGRAMVFLYYVPSDLSLLNLSIAGLDVRNVTRIDMAFAADPPYKGYYVSIYGLSVAASVPKVSLGSQVIDLTQSRADNSIYQNLGGRGRLYDSSRDNVEPMTTLPDDACSRTFLPPAGEHVARVSATGSPIFEEDFYSEGNWLGSFVVWRTREERDAAKLEKS